MADDQDDADDAASRLEAALERIARLAAAGGPVVATETADTELLAKRLDDLIDRVRTALDETSG